MTTGNKETEDKMADFTEIGKTNEIAPGMMNGVKVNGKDILIALVDGKYYAAAGHCPHMKAYLAKGKLNGTIVSCPLHGSQFDLKNGKPVRWVTGLGFMSFMGRLMSSLGMAAKKEQSLDVFEVKVEGERITAKIS
jgi:3-phenylpropionate/trans-cinnamate dioxygenase ferredoxin subunit